ncbi:MAG: 1-deoxy-D-xylulose-5-phosphate synthase N-terminal domain-containing protein [Chloroflexota bacterium]
MNNQDIAQLAEMAFRVRQHIIRMAGGGFIGGSLSCVEILVYLYTKFLNVHQHSLDNPNRDYLFLSKGHDVPALYGTLVELGWLESGCLQNYLKLHDSIYWHPNRSIPGVEFHSGSLGHLLAVVVGVALDCKLRQQTNKVVVITGDGELNEGSNWEALLVAHAYRLDNLVIIVDRNEFQANVCTETLIPLEPLAGKFEAFGCRVRWVDGHSFIQLDETLAYIPFAPAKPSVVIADTVRGCGLPSIERRADRWFGKYTLKEVEQLLSELHFRREFEPIAEALPI